MAIQLSDRDTMIFRFIEEHHVLLEKHIAWFIACDDKPVLIRDRLRKLFYLDYLLCERHASKLPWWTTPTKPLVYMLSPLSRQLLRLGESELDFSDKESQRHLLEVANLRMLFLVDQKEGLISEVVWTTVRRTNEQNNIIDAFISFKRHGIVHKIALINHPDSPDQVVSGVHQTIESKQADQVWIISREDVTQGDLQKALANTSIAGKLAFATHQDIYKSGIVKAKWQSSTGQYASVMTESVVEPINFAQSHLSLPAV